jgi:D-galactarolactone cycloisomerase
VAQLQPSIDGVGGYTGALQTMGMTRLHQAVYKPSCWSTRLHIAAMLHLLAVLPPPLLEFDTSENPLRDDALLTHPIEVERDGPVAVPTGPGLGVEVDEAVLARYAEPGV